MARNKRRTSKKRTRRQERRAAQRRRRLIQRTVLIGIGVLLVGGIGYLVYNSTIANPRPAAHPDEKLVASEGNAHLSTDERATYANNPPSSGPHYGSPAGWGYHNDEVRPEAWLHNLEHGGVVFLYHCPEGCPELQTELETLAGNLEPSRYGYPKIVVTSYALPLPGEVTALAWTRQLDLDAYDEKALTNFYLRYVDRGPEDVP